MINLAEEMRRLLEQRLAEAIREMQDIEAEMIKRKDMDEYTVARLATVTAKLEVIHAMIGSGK